MFQLFNGNIWCNKCSHNNGTNTCTGMMEIYMNHNTARLIIIIIGN